MTSSIQHLLGVPGDADEDEEFVAEEEEEAEEEGIAVALLPNADDGAVVVGSILDDDDDDDDDDDAPPQERRGERRPAFGWWVGLVVPAAALLGLVVSSYRRDALHRGGPLLHSDGPVPKKTFADKHKFGSSSSSSRGNATTPQRIPSPAVGNGSEPSQDDDDHDVIAAPWQTDVPNGLLLCQRHQIIEGRWDPVRLKEPPYRPPSNDTRCRKLHDPSYYASKRKGGGMWDTYQWIPNDSVINNDTSTSTSAPCHFAAWNRTMFCEVARYATVLIVGDSLSWENYASLALLSGAYPVHHGYQRMSWHTQRNIGHAVCDGHTRLVYRRDDYLDNLRDALLVDPGSNLPQVLILNRGAHYVNDTELLTGIRATLDVVEEWLGRCDQLEIKCHFFWRTTVPGHHHCRTFRAPVNDKATMEKHVADLSQYTAKEIPYHWYDFRHQNGLVEAELVNRKQVRHRIVDGYHINLLRPDGHNDCLHSCYPGKMDVYSQLLLHYLRGDRTWEDVQRLQSAHDDLGWNLNVTSEYDGFS
jgi:GDSL/SGNH-like Acyl-Esterase family found in Pmr5 and Cas1p